MAKILIAEDDKAMRVFLDRALSRSGHEVDAVPSGDTAARSVAKEAFNLLVMDIDMPGLNGVDLARQVLERARLGLPQWLRCGFDKGWRRLLSSSGRSSSAT